MRPAGLSKWSLQHLAVALRSSRQPQIGASAGHRAVPWKSPGSVPEVISLAASFSAPYDSVNVSSWGRHFHAWFAPDGDFTAGQASALSEVAASMRTALSRWLFTASRLCAPGSCQRCSGWKPQPFLPECEHDRKLGGGFGKSSPFRDPVQ